MADRVGQQLGSYRLLRLLGAGGFAEVYLGEHQHLGTQAAIKVLSAKLNAEGIERFREEARIIARLRHPHIVRVLDFGVEGNVPFLVMDFAPGGTLRQRHPRGPRLQPGQIASYLGQLASALQYAHDHHLIHRDVKPENMLVSESGEVLLSDFGIAIVSQSSRYQSSRDVTGTFAYMAPEQIQAHPRPASDQYSLAIVTYEWLTGSQPFHGSMSEILAKQIFASPPPLREKLPELPPAIEEVVQTALAKDPQQRFASVQAFATAFEQASGGARTRPFPAANRPSQPILTPTTFTSASSLSSQTAPAGSQTYLKNPREASTLRSTEAASTQIAASHPVSSPGIQDEARIQLARPETTITQDVRTQEIRRNVSRRSVLFGSVGLLLTGAGITWLALARTMSSQTSIASTPTPTLMPDPQHSPAPVPSATSTAAPKHSPTPISTVTPSNSPTAPVNTPTTPPASPTQEPSPTTSTTPSKPDPTLFVYRNQTTAIFSVAWSPDGSRIASAGNDGTVHVWNASTGAWLLTYTGHSKAVNTVAWSPDSSRIVSGSWDSTAQIWDASSGNTLLTYKGHSNAIFCVRWSPDGSRIATAGYDGNAQVWDASNGTKYVFYTGHGKSVAAVAWSPDSSRVVSGGYDNTAQVWSASNGTRLVTFGNHGGVVWTVSWSPGGGQIVSGSWDTTAQIWNAGNAMLSLVYTGHVKAVRSVVWSPDGSKIVSSSIDADAQEWYAGSGSRLLNYTDHTGAVWGVDWSPDGSKIVSGSDDHTARVWTAS